jgi:hypothetical protein
MECPICKGEKKVMNPAWEREFDRIVDNAPSGDIADERASRRYDKYIDCSRCAGTGQVKS